MPGGIHVGTEIGQVITDPCQHIGYQLEHITEFAALSLSTTVMHVKLDASCLQKQLSHNCGDHTVKIIDYQTGKCLKELIGHQRTPWVVRHHIVSCYVRYHPVYSDIIASGSLDHEVCLWDAKTSHCIGAHHFYRPIASIAFHANGKLLAVASGHKGVYSTNVQPTLSSLAQNSLLDAENQEMSQMVTPMDVCHGESSVANDHDSELAPSYARTELSVVRVQSDARVHSGSVVCERSGNLPNQVIVLQSRPDGPSSMPMELFPASHGLPYVPNLEHAGSLPSVPASFSSFGVSSRQLTASVPGVERLFLGTRIDEPGVHGISLSIGSEVPPLLSFPLSLDIFRLSVLNWFGTVVASRAIKAAHCLTSIQVYRVSDMELVRVLPSALDEVNVACFHPSPGAGLVYGTKEGKLRILQPNGANSGPDFFAEQNMLEELP
ncbi:hypothetical protein PR202_gb16946 [Eleusine coracana subsp. coracana]|uniref:Uncharacterized protein n=1 Tax=Eleusine coracana subsp. coracana TaxID=191504 RepID=A0AAV5F1P8_ELECO|nr:hypothetical protein PR202_gb16946 [Eleusine coracana subsp. coracana]